MKKTIITSAIALIITGAAFAQPVSDKAVIPLGVTLNQILRLHVIDGGNVEFVFNTMNEYNFGIPNSAFYDSRVVIASSTDWQLHLGAETALMTATDNALNAGITVNNIGFIISWMGSNTCCAAGDMVTMGAPYLNSNATANGLLLYTGGAGDVVLTKGALANGGDVVQNAFTISWQCGTQIGGGTSLMANTSLLVQSPVPDRYVDNAFLDLEAL